MKWVLAFILLWFNAIPVKVLAQDSLTNNQSNESIKILENSIESGIRYENFNKNYNNRLFQYFQYGRKVGRVDVFAKVLRYSLGSMVGHQFEGEAYWKFKRAGYSYFDAAYSNSFILPSYRFRVEFFQNKGKIEYSLGAGVVKPSNFRAIPLITGTIGYYFSDYFIYARPTFSYVDNGFTKSIFLQARRYFNKTNFVALSFLKGADTGTSRNLNAIANAFGSDTYLMRMNGQLKAGRFKLGAGLDTGGIYIPERSEYAQFTGMDIFIKWEF